MRPHTIALIPLVLLPTSVAFAADQLAVATDDRASDNGASSGGLVIAADHAANGEATDEIATDDEAANRSTAGEIADADDEASDDRHLISSGDGPGLEFDFGMGFGQDRLASAEHRIGGRVLMGAQIRYRLTRRWAVGIGMGAAFNGKDYENHRLYTAQFRVVGVGRYIFIGNETVGAYLMAATGYGNTTADTPLQEGYRRSVRTSTPEWLVLGGVGGEVQFSLRHAGTDLDLAFGMELAPSFALRDTSDIQAHGGTDDDPTAIGWQSTLHFGGRL